MLGETHEEGSFEKKLGTTTDDKIKIDWPTTTKKER